MPGLKAEKGAGSATLGVKRGDSPVVSDARPSADSIEAHVVTPNETFLEKTVGEKSVVLAEFGGVAIKCLLDSGSQVSETFYNTRLKLLGQTISVSKEFIILNAANSLEIPYLGMGCVVMLDIVLDGKTIPDHGVLVAKDIPGSEKKCHGILRTNIMKFVPAFAPLLLRDDNKINMNKIGVIKVAGSSPVLIPGASVCRILATSSVREKPVLVGGITNPHKELSVAPTLVDVSQGTA